MDSDRLKKLAGLPATIKENIDNNQLSELANAVYSLAEEMSYNNSAPVGRAVTGDQIYNNITVILNRIKEEAEQLIETRHIG